MANVITFDGIGHIEDQLGGWRDNPEAYDYDKKSVLRFLIRMKKRLDRVLQKSEPVPKRKW